MNENDSNVLQLQSTIGIQRSTQKHVQRVFLSTQNESYIRCTKHVMNIQMMVGVMINDESACMNFH